MLEDKIVLVKGAGDFASGTIRRLHIMGMHVVATELDDPLCVRRPAAQRLFGQNVHPRVQNAQANVRTEIGPQRGDGEKDLFPGQQLVQVGVHSLYLGAF